MAKCGFLVFGSIQDDHKEPSFQTQIEGYGANEPTSILLRKPNPGDEFDEKKDLPKPYHTIIPYAKGDMVSGAFKIVLFSQEDLTIKKLLDWKYKISVMGEWSTTTAGGCRQSEDTWRTNPSYKLQIPSGQKNFTMCVMLSQAKAGIDLVPYEVKPYQFFIGFYIEDKMDIVFENKNWKNALDVWDLVTLDSTRENVFTITPTTFRQGQLTSFTINVFADEDIKWVK